MSVDVSGKRFTVPREITASGNFLTVKFYVKDMLIPRSLYNRISWYSGTPNQLKYYREGDSTGVVVYNAGEWVSDVYYDIFSKITFATGTTLTDSEYEWLTSFAVEETLYMAEGDSMGKVANAIRDRSWAVGMYNFPDGFDAAIRAIGNYYTGATVAWNQMQGNTNSRTVSGVTFSFVNGALTVGGHANTEVYWGVQSGYENLDLSSTHVYMFDADNPSYIGDDSLYAFYLSGYNKRFYSPVEIFKLNANRSSQFNMVVRSGYTFDTDITFKPQLFDLTAALGSTIADYLYTLESNTPGAGVAKFKELFPDDYYPHQATPVLMSFKPGDWPMNAGTELRGLLTLDGEGWHRDADEYNNGVVLRKYAYPDMDNVGLDWRYNDTYDYFYTGDLYNSIGALKIDDTSPISFITDAYPTGGMILSTQGPADMTDGYIYQKSRNTSIGQGIILYVKDTSITSDHLNTFMTKIAGKKLVVKSATSSYYNP